MNKLGYIHDLDGHLVSFHMGQHGSHTLLAGGNYGLDACAYNLFDLLSGNLGRQFLIDHLEVTAAAAAVTLFPIIVKFDQLYSRNRSD